MSRANDLKRLKAMERAKLISKLEEKHGKENAEKIIADSMQAAVEKAFNMFKRKQFYFQGGNALLIVLVTTSHRRIYDK